MSLVSKAAPTLSDESKENIRNYENIINKFRGQSNGGFKSSDTINAIKSIKENITLGKNDLWSLCPILLYQMAAPTKLERSGCITTQLLPSENHPNYIDALETDRKMGECQ